MPGRASEPSRDGFGVDGSYETLRGFLLRYLGFFRDGDYMGEEAESEAAWGHHTQARRGPRSGHAWALSGHLAGSLLLPFWLRLHYGKIRYWGFVPCNSENISCTTFLKYKNSRKQELALRHLVNRLVPENAKKYIKVHIKHVGITTK